MLRPTWCFEDEHLLVLDKPPGLVSVPPPGQHGESALGYVKKKIRRQREARTWVIHRLDREVSGLMVFAMSEQGFLFLKEELRQRRMQRRYAAVVKGSLPVGQTRTLVHYLSDAGPAQPVRVETSGNDESLRAVTTYRVLASEKGRSLLEVRLETGRKHQIRAQFAAEGHPVIGDRRYGGPRYPRLLLHATDLAFAHPVTGGHVHLTSRLPAGFWKNSRVWPALTFESGSPHQPSTAKPAPASRSAEREKGWEHVAEWYDQLIEERRSDHHDELIFPGVVRLLGLQRGQQVLDVACGQGALLRILADQGIRAMGVDAAESLVRAANQRSKKKFQCVTGDARDLNNHPELKAAAPFDAACCVMALMNIDPLIPAMKSVAGLLKPGGKFVAVVLHPAFRSPGQTDWQWEKNAASSPADRRNKTGKASRGNRPKTATSDDRLYRRASGYLSPGEQSIVMNPGEAATGARPVTTATHHRPIQTYIRSMVEAGFRIDALEEWASLRHSPHGPRADEENRLRREIPMFLAFRGQKSNA